MLGFKIASPVYDTQGEIEDLEAPPDQVPEDFDIPPKLIPFVIDEERPYNSRQRQSLLNELIFIYEELLDDEISDRRLIEIDARIDEIRAFYDQL